MLAYIWEVYIFIIRKTQTEEITMTTQIKKHYPGCYRVSNGSDAFGQIRKDGRKWNAEIRKTETGEMMRFAGIWGTRKDAVEEIEHILERR